MSEEILKYINAVLDVYNVRDTLIPELLTQVNEEISLKFSKKEPEMFAQWFANVHKLKLRIPRSYSFDALEALYGYKAHKEVSDDTLAILKLIEEVSNINR